jgi:hypothetical protein
MRITTGEEQADFPADNGKENGRFTRLLDLNRKRQQVHDTSPVERP